MPSNQFGTEPAATGGAANLSNYYTKAETNGFLAGKCTKTGGKLDTTEVPDLAITSVTTVADNTARDALTVQQGDVAYVTGDGLTYMWSGTAWVQIDSTSVSWDNVKSSGNQSVTSKFTAVDASLSSAVIATGTPGTYQLPMRNSTNNGTEWRDLKLMSSGGAGTTLTALGHSYNEDGSQLNSQRTNIGGSSRVGHYVLKTFNTDWPLSYAKSGDNQTIHLGWVGQAGHDGQFLKYNHSTQTATWDAPSTTGGVTTFKNLSDTPGAYTNNDHFGLCVNGTSDGVVFRNLVLKSEGSSGITGTNHSMVGPTTTVENNYVKRLVAGSNITITQTGDSNQGLLISSTASGGSGGATIDDGNIATGTTWSSTQIANMLNTKAAGSHTHVIGDVTNLQGALDAKVDDTQVKTSNSTNAADVYSCTYINDTTKLLGTGSLTNQLLGWNGNGWGAQSVGASGTYLKSTGTGGLTYTNFINDSGNGASDQCYSSQKMYSDLQGKAALSHNHDSDYIKISDRKSAVSSTSTDLYDAGYLNTQLAARMSKTVTDMGSSGTQLYQVTGNALGLKRLAGGTNVTLSESTSGIVTITAAGGGSGGTTIAAGNTSSTPHVVWSGSAWVPGKVSLDDIVPNTSNANGKVLKYDGSTSSVTWQDDAQGSSVTLTSLLPSGGSNGQILKFNGTDMYWATDATSSGNADGVVTDVTLTSTGQLRVTTTLGSTTTVLTEQIDTDKIGWKWYAAFGDLPTASSYHGAIFHVHNDAAMYFSHGGNWHKIANDSAVSANATAIASAQATISGHTSTLASHLASIQTNANAIVPIQATVGAHTSAIATAEADIVTNTNAITLLQNKTQYQTASSNETQFSGDIRASNVEAQSTGTSIISHTRTTTSSSSYQLGQYQFKGINSASAAKTYGGISLYVTDHTSGQESSQLAFFYEHLGVTRAPLSLEQGQVRFSDNIKLSGSANLVFKDSTEQASAVTAPTSSGQVLTATGAGTWAWAAAAGGLTPLTSYTSSPNNNDVYSTSVINSRIDNMGVFPPQANQANMFLTTDGSTLGWGTIPVYTSATTTGVAPNAVYAVTHLNAVHTASDARHTALETKTQDMQLVGAGTLTRFNTSLDVVGYINASSAQSVAMTTTNTALHSANQTLNTYIAEGKNSAQAYTSYSKIKTEAKVGTSGSEYGQLTISTIDNGTVTEKLFVGQASSADADVKVLGALEVASTQYTSVAGTQSRPVTTPGAGDVGKVLTAANGSFSWAAAAGGSPSYPTYNMATTSPDGLGRGARPNIIIENQFFTSDHEKVPMLINGRRGPTGSPNEDSHHYNLRSGGSLIFWHITHGFNFNTVYLHQGWNATQKTNVFEVYASDDRVVWTQLASSAINNWASWSAPSSDSGISHQYNSGGGQGNVKLSWTQEANKYYRFYMLKNGSAGNATTTDTSWKGSAYNIYYTAIYEIEWGRE